ncbi:DUF3105 domain-containing protein [Pseudarthrobacter psychrotolerans]|uniref:DUF3105 domain-containing protein n=1 Tax=Pseudarthrobacter psychrotolerans TaxID=2697569 RepID=A0A6P1NP46_9MICC|nr:DUF3105 domain-containing protein [Pseudarthrobacter psychrotolerans]QHK18561.1 DUF3105 domain-containing protein [Pseudarthrobacter psychrotolerans]
MSGSTAKQARQDRVARLEAVKAAQSREARKRKLLWAGGCTVSVVLVGTLVAVALINDPPPPPAASIQIAGLQTFENLTSNHVASPVSYPQAPAVGGDHARAWLNCGVYSQPVPAENAVHALEHGAVWATYDPTAVSAAEAETLRQALPNTHTVLSPLEGTAYPIMLSAWGAQVGVDSPGDERVEQFVTKFWQSSNAPEPGAACTGGITAPGRTA